MRFGLRVGGVAPKFEQVQAEVREKIRGKIVVGHALFNDLAVSNLITPSCMKPLEADEGIRNYDVSRHFKSDSRKNGRGIRPSITLYDGRWA